MKCWKRGLLALVALSLMAGPALAGTRAGDKPPRATERKPEQVAQPAKQPPAARKPHSKVVPPLNVKIRPLAAVVAPAPPSHEPVLLPVSMEDDLAPARPPKLVPIRAYARDGASFYQNGHLIRVQGLAESGPGGEHAKQRLQQLLDAGEVSVLPVGPVGAEETLAVVRVNGRDLAEAMTQN